MPRAGQVLPVLLLLVGMGCSGDEEGSDATASASTTTSASPSVSPQAPAADKAVDVDLREFSIIPDATSIPAGNVTFSVENVGQFPHEFIVVRLAQGVTEVPQGADLSTKLDAKGVHVIDSIPSSKLNKGESSDLRVKLAEGPYVLLCNIVINLCPDCPSESHYSRGMHTSLSVTS